MLRSAISASILLCVPGRSKGSYFQPARIRRPDTEMGWIDPEAIGVGPQDLVEQFAHRR
jgi:hypothetical protein